MKQPILTQLWVRNMLLSNLISKHTRKLDESWIPVANCGPIGFIEFTNRTLNKKNLEIYNGSEELSG